MREADFTEDAPGRLVRILDGGLAFVPHPLPPTLPPPSGPLVNAQLKAAQAIGRLEQTLLHSDLDRLMVVHSLIRREAIFSSAIEGTVTSPEQLALFDASAARDLPKGDESTREVWNHHSAMHAAVHAVRQAGGRGVTAHLLRAAHKALMQGLPGVVGTPGEFRRLQNAIGVEGTAIQDAKFVPPPAAEVPHLMEDLVAFTNQIGPDSEPNQLVGLALQHYQFETIHPFPDGNGRLGRFLTTLTMTTRGLIPEPLLYVSAWLHKHKQQYCELMRLASERGEWEPWLLFFMRALEHSANDGVLVCNKLIELRGAYRRRVKPQLWPVVDLLFRRWVVTIRDVATATKKTDARAGQYLRQMESLKMAREITGGTKNLRYLSDEVLAVAFEPSTQD